MNNFTEIILDYNSGEMTKTERDEFKRNLNQNELLRKEFAFQNKLDKIMKQNLLLEAIENDPDLIKAEILARQDIDTYLNKDRVKNGKRNFNIFEVDTEVELQKKIAKAEIEMVLSGIDDISEEWVRDFDQSKPEIGHNIFAQQIVEFVKKSDPFEETAAPIPASRQRMNRKTIFQVAAATLLLSLLLLKALNPSYSGASVYSQYYEPLEASSFRLRGNSHEVTGKFQEGIEYYLSKDYNNAENAFKELRKMNEKLPEVLLFSGLNQMGQGNFPSAINIFADLLSADDQFVPEAQWYLGLCYIKTGDNLKARSLMETLSGTEGIYKKKAQLILKSFDR